MATNQDAKIHLHPFGTRATGDLEIACTIRLHDGTVHVVCSMQGELEKISIPAPAQVAARRNQLWENTCLECFIAEKSSESYWEVNLSPAGDWNIYRFDAYRQGMREENIVSALPMQVRRQPRRLHLSCTIDLAAIGLAQSPLAMGLAAVIRCNDGQRTYWAPIHPAPQPDFHHRDSFILEPGA
jgi:hypothetical protein